MEQSIVKKLEGIVGADYVSTGTPEKIMYLASSSDPDLCKPPGLARFPDVVVVPSNVEQVAEIVKLANEEEVPVMASGQRTTSFGCALPAKGGIVIDMCFMDKILEINEDYMVATVEGGCVSNRLFHELDQRGLMYPIRTWFDPQMTMGAYISTNGNGDYATQYGTSGENTVGLEVVLPTGEIVTLGSGAYERGWGHWHRFPCGPDLVGLQVGSSGTLGIITKAAVRIMERPKHVKHMTFGWRREDAALMGQALRKLHVYDGCSVWNIHVANIAVYTGLTMFRPDVVPPLPQDLELEFIVFIDEKGVSEEELRHKETRIDEICGGFQGVNLGSEANEIVVNPPFAFVQHMYGEMIRLVTKERADQGEQAKLFTYTYWHVPAVKVHEFYDLYEGTLKEFGKWDMEGLPFMLAWTHPPAIVVFYGGWSYDAFDPEDIEKNRKIWKAVNERLAERGANPYCIGLNFPEACKTNQGPAYELMKKVKNCLDPLNIMNPGQL